MTWSQPFFQCICDTPVDVARSKLLSILPNSLSRHSAMDLSFVMAMFCEGLFDKEFFDILKDFNISTVVLKWSRTSKCHVYENELWEDVFEAARDRLIVIRTTSTTLVSSKSLGNVQECFRIACLIHCSRAIRSSPRPSFYTMELAVHLHQTLIQTNISSFWHNHTHCLCWILFTGVTALPSNGVHPWILQLLRQVCDHLDLNTWESAQVVLKPFFWVDGRNDELFYDVWIKIEGLRQQCLPSFMDSSRTATKYDNVLDAPKTVLSWLL
jgi:hypothetical protein